MIIGIDSKGMIFSKNRGIGNYSLGICKALFAMKEHSFVILNWESGSLKDEYFSDFDNVEEYLAGDSIAEGTYTKEFVKLHLTEFIKKYSIDVFYDSSPMCLEFPVYDRSWFGNTMLVGTVHDYIPYLMKDIYFTTQAVYDSYLQRMYGNLQYDYLFSNSDNTRNDAIRILGMDESRIINISMDGNYVMSENQDDDNLISSYDLPGRFLTSAVWMAENKNIEGLLIGYGIAYKKNDQILDLVLTGKTPGRKLDRIVKSFGIQNKVHFLGYVTDAQLDAVYRRSAWLVFPSLYEGFGMSVVEAWRHSVPVITSDNSSLYEIASGASVMVDPTSYDSISEGILRACNMTDSERQFYVSAGIKRSKEFSWTKTAERFIEHVKEWRNGFVYDERKCMETQEDIIDKCNKAKADGIRCPLIKKMIRRLKLEKDILCYSR